MVCDLFAMAGMAAVDGVGARRQDFLAAESAVKAAMRRQEEAAANVACIVAKEDEFGQGQDERKKFLQQKAMAKKLHRTAKKDLKRSIHALKEIRKMQDLQSRSPDSLRGRVGDTAVVISEASDSRLDTYRNLRQVVNPNRDGLFIVEGPESIALLLKAVHIEVLSIFCKPTVFERLKILVRDRKNYDAPTNRSFQVFIASSTSIMTQCVGYSLQRGALACGRVPLERDESWLMANVLLGTKRFWRVLAIDGCNNTANMGSLLRTASAFGIEAVLLSSDCCDAWYRQSVRVSMGHIFRTPVVRVADLAKTLRRLASDHNLVSFAAVIDQNAIKLEELPMEETPSRWCGVVGSEDKGISVAVREVSKYLCRIDMAPGVDSLAITVASGVFLNGLREREAKDRGW